VQEPLAGEAACSWAVWSDGAGGKPVIQYDPNWGKIKLETSQVGHSNVIDTGDTQNKTLTVTPDVYGAGSGVGGVYIRGQATSFNQDAALPAWELYSGPVTKAWRWIQVKLTGPVDG